MARHKKYTGSLLLLEILDKSEAPFMQSNAFQIGSGYTPTYPVTEKHLNSMTASFSYMGLPFGDVINHY